MSPRWYILGLLLLVLPGVSSAAVSAVFSGNVTTGAPPLAVAFTDASTGSPSVWAWFFGDETWNPAWNTRTSSAGWMGRIGHTTSGMQDGSIVLLGGVTSGRYNDTWRSTDDGATWTNITGSPGWNARSGHATALLSDGSLVIIAGYTTGRVNDVWRSTDNGVTWTNITTAGSTFPPRDYPGLAVLSDDTILIIGGRGATNFDDTWRSTDQGATWTNITGSGAKFSKRYYPAIFTLQNGTIILLGGSDGTRRNDAWRSTDSGVTWTNITGASGPGFVARLTPGITMPDNSMMVFGGSEPTRRNDIWRSVDGIAWTQVNSTSTWTARSDHAVSLMRDGNVILTGGTDGSARNNVFRGVYAASSTQSPTHTYTANGNYTVTLKASDSTSTDTESKISYISVMTFSETLSGFTANVTSGAPPLSVGFSVNESADNATSWNWGFGDGEGWQNGSVQNASHQYTIPGNYTVTEIASNAGYSSTTTRTDYIRVLNLTPPGNITNLTGTLLNCSSIEWTWDNPTDWDFNYVQIWQNGTLLYNLTSPDNTDTWTSLAESVSYTISLKAVDLDGYESLGWTNATVDTGPCGTVPVAGFKGYPTEACLNESSHQFTDQSTNVPTAWNWSFGDDTYSDLQNPVHSYTEMGPYTVNLTSENKYGTNTTSKTDYISITGICPTPVTGGTGTPEPTIVKLQTNMLVMPFLIIPLISLFYLLRGGEDSEGNELHNPIWGDLLAAGLGGIVCAVVVLWFVTGGIASAPVTVKNATYTIADGSDVVITAYRTNTLGERGTGMFLASGIITSMNQTTVSTYDSITQQFQDFGVAFFYMLLAVIMAALFIRTIFVAREKLQEEDEEIIE